MTADTTPAPIGADALIDELEYAVLGVGLTGNLDRVRAAKAALRAALASAAQPAPKAAPTQSEWPLLEHEAALHEDGTARFGPGVSAKLLVEAAYRNAERTKERQQMTDKQRQEEERKRRVLWDMVHGAPASAPAAQGAGHA